MIIVGRVVSFLLIGRRRRISLIVSAFFPAERRLRLVLRSGIDPQRIDALLAPVNAVESLKAPLIVPFAERQREAVGRMEGIGAQCRVGPYARSAGEARRDDREPIAAGSRGAAEEKSTSPASICASCFGATTSIRARSISCSKMSSQPESNDSRNKSAQAVRNRSAEPARRIGIVPDVGRDSESHVSAPPAGKPAESLSVRIGVLRSDRRASGRNGRRERFVGSDFISQGFTVYRSVAGQRGSTATRSAVPAGAS